MLMPVKLKKGVLMSGAFRKGVKFIKRVAVSEAIVEHMSRDMRFPTMWYMRPVKPQISLRIRAV